MYIRKLALSRRALLRGAGAGLALPLLDAMVPALARAEAGKAPLRVGFTYIANGAIMEKWTPEKTGADYEMTPILQSLTPFRDKLTILSGLEHANAFPMNDGAGDHSRAGAVWLSGLRPKYTEGADIRAGTTIDQILAQQIGRDTQLSSLELGLDLLDNVGMCENGYSCVYLNTISWRTPTTPMFPERNPRAVFEGLFGVGGTPQERALRLQQNDSILDSVSASMSKLKTSLGAGDRQRVEEYLDSVREIERRIQKAESRDTASLKLPELPAGVPDSWEEHCKLMFDLQIAAFQTDTTRVSSIMLGRELGGTPYPNSGVPDGHHNLTHHRNNPAMMAKVEKINTYHVKMFSEHFLAKLAATPDGDGTLLDHMMIMYGGGISNGNLHDHANLPTFLVGGANGRLKGGRHLRYPDKTPFSNLLTTILEKSGAPMEVVGDSSGRLSEV